MGPLTATHSERYLFNFSFRLMKGLCPTLLVAFFQQTCLKHQNGTLGLTLSFKDKG